MPSILTIHIALKVLVVLIRDLTRINLCPIVRMYLGMALRHIPFLGHCDLDLDL